MEKQTLIREMIGLRTNKDLSKNIFVSSLSIETAIRNTGLEKSEIRILRQAILSHL